MCSRMLVVLGGLLGNGARTLADQLAARFGLYHYDIARKKIRHPTFDRRGDFRILQPRTDKDRVKVYENVCKDFPLLSKMYPDVVVDDTFHRDIPREYFLSEARKYYTPVVFVWIESDEASVRVRLERIRQAGKIESVDGALRRREKAHAKQQPFPPATPIFFHRTSGKEGIAAQQIADQKISALWELIQEHAHS